MAQLGDIVMVESGVKYVVVDLVGGPNGARVARLLRRKSNGDTVSFTKDEAGLSVVASNPFQMGDSVTVNGLRGDYLGTENGIARVLLAERSHPLKGGGHITLDAAVARISHALLVLENRSL